MTSLRPHQNININISYNLGSDKSAKAVIGKKIIKSQKATCLPTANQFDVASKLKNQKSENITKKCLQIKQNTDSQKKHHRKKVNIINRNSLTADLIQQRRIRTQGPSADMDASSTFKRQSKSKAHFKSTQPASSGKLSQSRLKIGLNKTSKSLKGGRAFSQLGCQWKKIPIDISQYTISQSFNTISKKIKSNCSFFGNDKVVSKLLNISLLASQLSNSQPITSQRRSNAQSHSACLKQYMSSIDIRLISRMQDDVPVFAKKESSHQDYVRSIMRAKSFSLEELTRQVIRIQRFWKGKIKNRVVNKYKSLFQEISDRLNRSQKSQISAIFAESESSEAKLSLNIGQSASRRQSKRGEQYLQEDENSDSQLEWVKQNKIVEKRGNVENKLKIGRQTYVQKQLCQIKNDHLEQKDNLLAKVNKDHFIRWNNINKKIGNIINDKRATNSAAIMDALMKQSNINQKWIDDGEVNHSNGQIHLNQQDSIDPQIYLITNQKKENQCSLSLENHSLHESLNYNPIQFESKARNTCQSQQKNKQEICGLNPSSFRQQQRMTAHEDQMWIVQQMTNSNIVQNYLECEFQKFDLNFEAKDSFSYNNFVYPSETVNNEQKLCSDQSVEIEFQSPNVIISKNLKARERKFKIISNEEKIDNEKVDIIVNEVISFLISQFSIDVSYILKKSGNSKAERPIQPAPHVVMLPCIQTNFDSIKEYINRFIIFLQKNDAYLTRITYNINKNNGPSSKQILSYLRPEEDLGATKESWAEEEENQDDVFIIPGQFFQQFGDDCQTEYRNRGQKELAPRVKAFLSFWHRCLYQSFNECLDYERPYGIIGKPYEWNTEPKIFRKVTKQRLQYHMHRAKDRLLGIAQLVGGIIFEKSDSPFSMINFNEQQRQMMNEERLSRILATELLQSEQSWVIYHDQTAQLMVQLARMIKDMLWFQTATEIKKLQIRRKNIQQPQGPLVGLSLGEL